MTHPAAEPRELHRQVPFVCAWRRCDECRGRPGLRRVWHGFGLRTRRVDFLITFYGWKRQLRWQHSVNTNRLDGSRWDDWYLALGTGFVSAAFDVRGLEDRHHRAAQHRAAQS